MQSKTETTGSVPNTANKARAEASASGFKAPSAKCRFCGKKHGLLFHPFRKRSLFQRIDKMERMQFCRLSRFYKIFRSMLTMSDRIVLQRLGVI